MLVTLYKIGGVHFRLFGTRGFHVKAKNERFNTTSFPGSLFSASLSRWNRDPGWGWSRDHPESGWQKNLLEGWGNRVIFYRPLDQMYFSNHPPCGFGSIEAEKRDPGNEVDLIMVGCVTSSVISFA